MGEIKEPGYISIKNVDGSNILIRRDHVYLTTDDLGNHYLRNIYTDRSVCTLDDESYQIIFESLHGGI